MCGFTQSAGFGSAQIGKTVPMQYVESQAWRDARRASEELTAAIATGASATVVAELVRAQAAADDRVETLRRIAQLISRGA
jgi:hypothetical protein